MTRIGLCLLALLTVAAAPADRFPQPVRAGDLAGRTLIGPVEAQPVLGRVEGVDQAPDGSAALRVRTGGLLPWARRSVDLPLGAVALLGEHVALTGLTRAQYDGLPTAPAATPIDPAALLRIGLARPFH